MSETNNTGHNHNKAALVIGAHFDDCEGGSVCGTALKLKKMGYRVFFLNTMAPVWGYLDTHTQEDLDRFHNESKKASAILGIEKIILDYTSPPCPTPDPTLIAMIARVYLDICPEFVFIPWPKDNHVDHVRTAHSAFTAICYPHRFAAKKPVRLREVFAYHISPWQTVNFNPDFYIDVTDEMTTIGNAVKSFSVLANSTHVKETQRRFWGQGRCEYAEGFIHLGPQFPMQSIIPHLFGNSFYPAGSGHYPWGKRYFQ